MISHTGPPGAYTIARHVQMLCLLHRGLAQDPATPKCEVQLSNDELLSQDCICEEVRMVH